MSTLATLILAYLAIQQVRFVRSQTSAMGFTVIGYLAAALAIIPLWLVWS